MGGEPSTKSTAWTEFDRIVAEAAPGGVHGNPWVRTSSGDLGYTPDHRTLRRLLAVPLRLRASTTTGVPALALDVWLSYELRRAGFDPDAVWPRATSPRVLPAPIVSLLDKVSSKERDALWRRLSSKTPPAGVAASNAIILGKNYLKQVDVGMSGWATGPELLISTKRMDSSFGKNAANRVEESYGDAKNLRLRHPLAALGFVYGLRSTIFDESPDTAEWLIDLLQKLGREDDAYHAVALVVIDYDDTMAVDSGPDDPGDDDDPLADAGLRPDEVPSSGESDQMRLMGTESGEPLRVDLQTDRVPPALRTGAFLAEMVTRVLDATPVNFHREARRRRREAPSVQDDV